MRLKILTKRGLLYLAISILAILFFIPIIWVFFLSFKTNIQIASNPIVIPNFLYLKNYEDAWKTVNVPRIFANTAFIAIISVSLELVICVFSSYAIARFKLKQKAFQDILYVLFISGLVIPVFILIFPIYKMTTIMHLTNSYLSLILPYLAIGLSFNTLLLVGGLKSFPNEIEEAALIDGCNIVKMVLQVVAPIIKPLIATVIIFNALGIWNEFPLASILINKESMKTVAISITKFRGLFDVNYASTAAFVVIIVVPQLVFYMFFQKYIIAGMTAGAIKG